MRGRKTPSTAAKAKTSQRMNSSSKQKNGHHQKLQSALKKAHETNKQLQKKLNDLHDEWKNKMKQIEEDATEKARASCEREHTKKKEALKKVIENAISKFEKQYGKSQRKRTSAKSSSRLQRRKSAPSNAKKRATAK